MTDPDITYVQIPHWNTSDPKMKAYDVYVNGEHIGKIERAVENTDRHQGRIRIPGKGRLAWSWYRFSDGRRNYPGLYPHSRAAAVKAMMAR